MHTGTLVMGTIALALGLAGTDWAGDASESGYPRRTFAGNLTSGTSGQSGPAISKQKARAGSRSVAYRTFQVPAGTPLPIELRTALASDRNQVQDYVRGRLREAIVLDETELVPAGATILGTVIEAAPARTVKDRGRLSIRFDVIEHPQTGSRVMIRTEAVAFEGQRVDAKQARAGQNEVRLPPGADVSASTVAPFLVFIPK